MYLVFYLFSFPFFDRATLLVGSEIELLPAAVEAQSPNH